MTAKELIKILERVPAYTPINLFDRHQYLENGYQLMDNCYVPLNEVFLLKDVGIVLNSTDTGIEFEDDEENYRN